MPADRERSLRPAGEQPALQILVDFLKIVLYSSSRKWIYNLTTVDKRIYAPVIQSESYRKPLTYDHVFIPV